MKLIDLPRQISPSVYEETRETVRKKYATIPGVVDVIEYGTIPHPGISDMDFIIVIEPGAHVDIPPLRTYSPEEQYAMDHAHFVISTNILPHLRLLDPFIVNFTPLLGRTSFTLDTITTLSSEELRAFALEYPFVSWILPWLQFFVKVQCLNEIPCRYFLEGIKLLPYSFRELHRAGLINDPNDSNAACFRSLANQWFQISEKDRPGRIEEALEKNRVSTKRYLEILHKGLTSNSKLLPTKNQKLKTTEHSSSITYNFGSEVYVFEQDRININIDFTRTHSPLTPQTYSHIVHYLPLFFSAPLNRLLFENGYIPDHIRKHISTDLSTLPVLTHPILEKRTQLMNHMIHDVRNVRGGKLLGQTYGFRTNARADGGSLHAKMGGVYDRLIERCSRNMCGKTLKHEHLRITF